MKRAIALLALTLSMHVHADDEMRNVITDRIVSSLNIQQLFEKQQEQSKAIYLSLGKNVLQKMLADLGIPENQMSPRLKKAFSDYLEQCATLFTIDELVTTWSSAYVKNMSDEDLAKILAYYESPIGKKDVQASQFAITEFNQMMAIEGQKRMMQAMSKLAAEIKAATMTEAKSSKTKSK